MNKFVHLGLSIKELSAILMYEFSYDYAKRKYGDNCVIWIQTVLLYT